MSYYRTILVLICSSIIVYLVYILITKRTIVVRSNVSLMNLYQKTDQELHYNLSDFEAKVQKFIVKQNLSSLTRATPLKSKSKSKKPTKPRADPNFRLNRLLYQLWDPNTKQNEHNMFSCQHLVSNDRNLYYQGKRFARKLNKKFYEYATVSDIMAAIGPSCNNLRKLFRYQTPNYGPASFSIAYTITLERTAEQSLRMLLGVYHHDNVYCLHPNAKYGISYLNLFRKVSDCIPNIVIPDRVFEIRVKTHNRLKAEIECYKKLTSIESIPWRYGINVQSSVFPLYNNSVLVRYLRDKPYEVLINWNVPSETRFMTRVKYKHVVKIQEGGERAIARTSKEKSSPPDNITLYRKGGLFIGTKEFYEKLITSPIAKEFLEWTRDTRNPEDFFYSSLYKYFESHRGHVNPHLFSENIPKDITRRVSPDHDLEDVSIEPESDLVISLWGSDKGARCHGKYRGPRCIFASGDLKWLLQQPFLFAASFDFRVDRFVIDCLSKNLKEPIMSI